MSEINLEDHKKIQDEVSQLKTKIHEINNEKEIWFKKKEELKKELNELITKIKENKSVQDKNSIELKELKSQRDKYNSEVKTLIKDIQKLNKEKLKSFQKYNIRVDPSNIQAKINALEKRVEMEVDFAKEKKLMDEIKKLKRTYAESSEVVQLGDNIRNLDQKIKETKTKADEFHKKIQEIMKDSKYDSFIVLSKQITAKKKEQEAAFQKFIDFKKEYIELNNNLQDKLAILNKFRESSNQNREVKRYERDQKQKQFLRKNIEKVEEKIKSKKRLTTEDIIAMQGLPEEN
jgi:uncharacterized coiled-coil DUF342 family protein